MKLLRFLKKSDEKIFFLLFFKKKYIFKITYQILSGEKKIVSDDMKAVELQFIEAVKRDGYVLEQVPERFKTAEVCLAAVQSWGYALEYVPEQLKTETICLEAIKNGDYFLGNFCRRESLLKCVPQALKLKMKRAIKEIEEAGFSTFH